MTIPSWNDLHLQQHIQDALPAQPQLSHLMLIPVPPQLKSVEPLSPTLLMVFSYVSDPQTSEYQESYSIIARWALQSVQPKLHSQFEQGLGAKKAATSKGVCCLTWLTYLSRARLTYT